MKKLPGTRIWELDFLRGFSVLMMIGDHLLYDLASFPVWFRNYYQVNLEWIRDLSGFAAMYWGSDLRTYGHWFFIILFFGVSGISFTFSRNNLKRGLKFAGVAVLIFLFTYFGEKWTGIQLTIVSGVISIFALSTLLAWLLRKIWNNDVFIFIVGTLAVLLGFFLGGDARPGALTWANVPLMFLGFVEYGADYFTLFPYSGFLILGTVVGNRLYRSRKSLFPHLDRGWNAPACFVGRNSLWFFLLHQPVIFGLLIGIAYSLGYHF